MKEKIDIGRVPAHQHFMHERLVNWAMWAKPGQSVSICPMFKQAKSNSFQWHPPEYRPTCDTLDAQYMEKAICKLPDDNRKALVWWYIYRTGELAFRKKLGVTLERLDILVINGRQHLMNTCG